MSSPEVAREERTLKWDVPGAGQCETKYWIYGELKSGVRPLVVLHGGPGVTSDYLNIFSDLTLRRSIPVVLYDQLGNGKSTHLPHKRGDTSFWTIQLFLDELKQLLTKLEIYGDYDLLGHSWGGILASEHAVRQPSGLKHLVIMSSPASGKLWIDAQLVLRKTLPADIQAVLDKCEADGTTESEEYKSATQFFYSRFLCTLNPMPEDLQKSFQELEKDPTVYLVMNGPSEFYMVGSLKDWSIVDEVHKISVPTLLTNGAKDEAADSVIYPFFKSIPRVRWVQFANSSHMAHFEERKRFFTIIGDFLME